MEVKGLMIGIESLQEVNTFKFPEREELEQAYKAFIKEDLSEYPDISFVPEFARSQLTVPEEDKFLSILYIENQLSGSRFIARCLVAETSAFEGTLQFDCRAQVVNHFGLLSIKKIPLLTYLYRMIEQGPVMIHSIKPQQDYLGARTRIKSK